MVLYQLDKMDTESAEHLIKGQTIEINVYLNVNSSPQR